MVDDTAAFPSIITNKLYSGVARLSTTLSSDITNSTTPIPVASVTGFPAKGFITIDNETIYYDGNTTTLGSTSATRGYAGTAVAHLSGAAVKYSIVASTINRIQAEIVAEQTHMGTSGGTQGFVNARYLGGSTENQLSPTLLGGSTEGQLNVGLLGGSTEGQLNVNYWGGSTQGEVVLGTSTIASGATPTPVRVSQRSIYTVTALATDPTFAAPSGSPQNGDTLVIRIEDDGTARTLAWNAIYEAAGETIPTSTTISKKLYVGFIYNSTDSKWDCVAVSEEA